MGINSIRYLSAGLLLSWVGGCVQSANHITDLAMAFGDQIMVPMLDEPSVQKIIGQNSKKISMVCSGSAEWKWNHTTGNVGQGPAIVQLKCTLNTGKGASSLRRNFTWNRSIESSLDTREVKLSIEGIRLQTNGGVFFSYGCPSLTVYKNHGLPVVTPAGTPDCPLTNSTDTIQERIIDLLSRLLKSSV